MCKIANSGTASPIDSTDENALEATPHTKQINQQTNLQRQCSVNKRITQHASRLLLQQQHVKITSL